MMDIDDEIQGKVVLQSAMAGLDASLIPLAWRIEVGQCVPSEDNVTFYGQMAAPVTRYYLGSNLVFELETIEVMPEAGTVRVKASWNRYAPLELLKN